MNTGCSTCDVIPYVWRATRVICRVHAVWMREMRLRDVVYAVYNDMYHMLTLRYLVHYGNWDHESPVKKYSCHESGHKLADNAFRNK